LSNLLLENPAQWLGCCGQMLCIAGSYKVIQALMERENTHLKSKHRNQLLIRTGEAIGLDAGPMKLPDDKSIASKNQSN
jgi:hypothetical protein